MAVEISDAGIEALDAVEELWRSLYRHHCSVTPHLAGYEAGEEQSWINRRSFYERHFADADARAFFTLAHLDTQLVGYAMTSVLPASAMSWVLPPSIAELHTLSVDASQRRGGIGTALLSAVRTTLLSLGVQTLTIGVITTNDSAQEFYRTKGLLPFHSTVVAALEDLGRADTDR